MTTETHSGGCQCGAVRFRVDGPLGDASAMPLPHVPEGVRQLLGAPLVSTRAVQRRLDTRGATEVPILNAVVARGFCADCGTPLFMHEDTTPALRLSIGSLDDPDGYRPTRSRSASRARSPSSTHRRAAAGSYAYRG